MAALTNAACRKQRGIFFFSNASATKGRLNSARLAAGEAGGRASPDLLDNRDDQIIIRDDLDGLSEEY